MKLTDKSLQLTAAYQRTVQEIEAKASRYEQLHNSGTESVALATLIRELRFIANAMKLRLFHCSGLQYEKILEVLEPNTSTYLQSRSYTEPRTRTYKPEELAANAAHKAFGSCSCNPSNRMQDCPYCTLYLVVLDQLHGGSDTLTPEASVLKDSASDKGFKYGELLKRV